MWYIKEDITKARGVGLVLSLFVRPWVAMLALGGLGHRLELPFLEVDYWTVFLGYIVITMAFSHINPDYKAAQSREELI